MTPNAAPACCHVAPFTGAWIEIINIYGRRPLTTMSHPSRVRGLKCNAARRHFRHTQGSHPSRVRGLKFLLRLRVHLNSFVAPFTGAWIEISRCRVLRKKVGGSHPSRVRGLKSYNGKRIKGMWFSRTLHGCVD